jgi:hypothetical protein
VEYDVRDSFRFRFLLSNCQLFGADVDRRQRTLGPDPFRHPTRNQPVSAADFDDLPSRTQTGTLEQLSAFGTKDLVQDL